MLLFNRIRESPVGRRSTDSVYGPHRTPTTGARDQDNGDNETPSTMSQQQREIMPRFPRAFSLRRQREHITRSKSRGLGPPPVEPELSPFDELGNPLEPFSSVTDHGVDGAVKSSDVPDIIAGKLQGHHKLWYRLAHGRRPNEKLVSVGSKLHSILSVRSLPRLKQTSGSGLKHFASWRSRSESLTEGRCSSEGDGRRTSSFINYGNADEVVLCNTQDDEEDILYEENKLPEEAPSFIIHPYDNRKVTWDVFIAVLIIYGCVDIPLRIGFDLEAGLGQLVADSAVDITFFLDIVLSFRTAFFAPDGDLVTNLGDIAIRYLKRSFIVDLVSTVPLDLVMLAWGGEGSFLRSIRLLRALKLLRLARILRLSSFLEHQEDDVRSFMHPSVWSLTKMLVMLLFIAHLMACMWRWAALLRSDDVTWVTAYGVENTSWMHQYLVGVYWAVTTMTTVGYGDITSANDLERIFATVGMIIGATVFGYIIGNVAIILENFDVMDSIESDKMNHIQDWLHDRKFPAALAEKIRRQYRYIYKEMSVFDSSEILDAMPDVMSTSMVFAQHRAIMKGVGFLEKRPPVLVCRLLQRMIPSLAHSGDVLYLEHEIGEHWFILRRGKISFYVSLDPLETQSEVVCMRSLTTDGHFGLAPVLLNVLKLGTVDGGSCDACSFFLSETATATATCDLMTIRKDDLLYILQQWPEVMEEVTLEAEQDFQEIQNFRATKRGQKRPHHGNRRPKPNSRSTKMSGGRGSLRKAFSSLSPSSLGVPSSRARPTSTGKKNTPPLHKQGPEEKQEETMLPEEEDDARGAAVDDAELFLTSRDYGSTESKHPSTAADGVEDATALGVAGLDGVVSTKSVPVTTVPDSGDESESEVPTSTEGKGLNMSRIFDEDDRREGLKLPTDLLSPWCSDATPSEDLSSHSVTEMSNRVGDGNEETRRLRLEASEIEAASGMCSKRPRRVCSDRAARTTDSRTLHSPPRSPPPALDNLIAEETEEKRLSEEEKSFADPQVGISDVEAADAIADLATKGVSVATDSELKHRPMMRYPPPIITRWASNVDDATTTLTTVGTRAGRIVEDERSEGARLAHPPDNKRRCSVAKTFSPSDLGLVELRRVISVDDSMPAETTRGWRWGTIEKGLSRLGIGPLGGGDGRKTSIDEVFGFDDTQTVLGDVPPGRLLSLTGMFHPDAPVKISWDLWVSLVIIWSVVEVTYRLGFDRPATGGWVALSYAIDVLFLLDVLVTFRTALLTRNGVVVARPGKVAISYLQGWFVVDVVSAIPWDLLVLKLAVGYPHAASSTRLVRSLRLSRLVRLVRLLKIPDFMEEWMIISPFGPSSVKLLRLLLLIMFSAHINACVWYAAGLYTKGERSWIQEHFCADEGYLDECPGNQSSFSLYLASIYFAFTTMTTTGYGDILPNQLSVEELTVAIASEVIGATLFAWVIGNIVNLVLNLDPAERNRKSMMNYLTEYLRVVPLSSKAKQTIARNYAFHLEVRSVFNQSSILGDLAPYLQNQAYVFMWRSLLPKLPFLCSMEDEVTGFVRVVLPLLKPVTFAVGDLIVTPLVGTRDMGFIVSGKVEVRLATRKREYKTTVLGERHHFGEIFMLLSEHVPFRGLARVRATTRVRLMQLTRGAFTTLEARHPHVASFMAQQLYEPSVSPLWAVVSDDFKCEVERLEQNAAISAAEILVTPRSPAGNFFEEKENCSLPSPKGSSMAKKRVALSPPRPTSRVPVGVAARREPATQQVLQTKANRMANQRVLVRKR